MPIKIAGILKSIKKQKERCVRERDALRNLLSDLEDIVASFDEADDALDRAIQEIEGACDSLSQYL